MAKDTWAKEFDRMRGDQVEREKRLAEVDQALLEERAERKGAIVPEQVKNGTTIEARAADGDLSAQKALINTSLTEPNLETGEYEITSQFGEELEEDKPQEEGQDKE